MLGINNQTGQRLSGLEHLFQSIKDILTTPIGTRIMRRDYGSELPRLVDKPISSELLLNIYSATAVALKKWEPRFKINKIMSSVTEGRITIILKGKHIPTDNDIVLDGIIL